MYRIQKFYENKNNNGMNLRILVKYIINHIINHRFKITHIYY